MDLNAEGSGTLLHNTVHLSEYTIVLMVAVSVVLVAVIVCLCCACVCCHTSQKYPRGRVTPPCYLTKIQSGESESGSRHPDEP